VIDDGQSDGVLRVGESSLLSRRPNQVVPTQQQEPIGAGGSHHGALRPGNAPRRRADDRARGGVAGSRPRRHGISAELVMATDTMGGRATNGVVLPFEGARVVLHEYAPGSANHLVARARPEPHRFVESDGCGSRQPCGNSRPRRALQTKRSERRHDADNDRRPRHGNSYWATSVSGRDPARDLTMVLLGPDGTQKTIDTSIAEAKAIGGKLVSPSTRSACLDPRHRTSRLYLASPTTTAVPVPVGTWTLTGPTRRRQGTRHSAHAYTQDESPAGAGSCGSRLLERRPSRRLSGTAITACRSRPSWPRLQRGHLRSPRFLLGPRYRIDGQKILDPVQTPITAGNMQSRAIVIVYGGTSGGKSARRRLGCAHRAARSEADR